MITLQQVELGVLGPLQVRQYGLPVAIPGAKPRAILTMLGLHSGSVVAADTLLKLLWGAEPPRTAAKALQTHISSLRRTLGDGFVLTQGTGWTVSTAEVDATRYQAAARLGRDAIAAGDVSQAVTRFDEALALWRGTPELPDSPRGVSEKTRWVEGHAALVEDRADALLATGRAAEIIGELEAAVGDAPLRERRWGQLMLALYRAGRQGEALGAYQRARSLLVEELGVDPGPDLRRLEAAIVAQDESLEIPVLQHLSVVTRAVTFLLTDIEGSTAAWEADADAMGVALARHDEVVEQVVTSRGGRLVKTRGEGDATFSVFDRPSAAAAAAIALQEAIAHEPWELAEPMRIRVALHTGEVELRDGDYFGRAVNRAARLRSLATGGQILCSGATAELVIDTLRDDVVLADLGMRQLKNLARPEHVFELRLETVDECRAATPDAPMERPALPAVLAGPGPFVGRGHELERLLAAWHTTLATGTRAVLIAGEPGVGKTRLAGEWSRQAYEQGAVVLYGRCDEDMGAPYQPFAEALRSLVSCLGATRLRGLRGVEALLSLVPGLIEVLPDLAAAPRADPDTERFALFDAVVGLLGIASASAPVVLILDDLHWAAKPTLLLLRHLLRFGDHARVQIVGTYRSTDLDRSHPLAAMLAGLHRDGSADRLALGGLDENDVTAYVAEAGYDDEELARALASVTGGNPFFLIEALRHVDESGGHWDPSTLPQGVREAVSRRLSRLPAETNKALAAAAVVGSRFRVDLVERVVEQDLVDAFDEARKAGILIEEPGGHYRFNHALVRQSLLTELASVRRMRLHQRIAAALEAEPGADEELLAELAYHYFECAWAGNAVKAVEYCRRAADQAMARLAYEGAADLYDKALHALDELDDELPDRDDVQAELLIARCEALLAAGDVVSATGALAQLQSAAGDSARLAAWGACFDGQLSMLTDPERLDEIEAALSAAAAKLAELGDAAGEAKAHTVRAACLARLGRVGDCETALDQALTAARHAREHRRVNAVLAGAPLAALWGPNPVPRAGGRCLDVVRLLRITTGSPVVEATSTRCQGMLDAFRGRAAAGRQLIDSARRTLTELGMRHALLEVEQFAGIVELVADDPAAAEQYLRRAYNGFRRMGLDADTAETAALLARACLALDKDAEADELCTSAERLAGHAFKAAIAWRTVRAQLLARRGDHDGARRTAEEAVAIAERTDALVDHGDACMALATVLGIAGDAAGARTAAERAVGLYELKGAASLAEKARGLLSVERAVQAAPGPPEDPTVQPDNACVQVLRRLDAAYDREAWEEVAQLIAETVHNESRRKIVGLECIDRPKSEWLSEAQHYREMLAPVRYRHVVVAVLGERLALTRLDVGPADRSPGAPRDEVLQLYGLDREGRLALQVWFDVEDIDAALVELDAQHARFEQEHAVAVTDEPENACVRALNHLSNAIGREAWDEYGELFSPEVVIESRRKMLGFDVALSSREWAQQVSHLRGIGAEQHRFAVIAVRGQRLALTRLEIAAEGTEPGTPREEVLCLERLDQEGRFDLVVLFDIEDIDTAIAELDAQHARLGQHARPRLENTASRVEDQCYALFAESRVDEIGALLSDNHLNEDRRQGLRRQSNDRAAAIDNIRAIVDLGGVNITNTPVALRGDRLCLSHIQFERREAQRDAFRVDTLELTEVDIHGIMTGRIVFELDDLDAAFAELDTRYIAGEAAPYAHAWSVIASTWHAFNHNDYAGVVNIDHRRAVRYPPGELTSAMYKDVVPNLRAYIEVVHRLSNFGAVVTHVAHGTSQESFDTEWRDIHMLTANHDMFSGSELFEEADLDAALARFDELSRLARRLENAASQMHECFWTRFADRDWAAMAQMLADEYHGDDRRRVVNAGIRRGRDAEIANLRVFADLGVGIELRTSEIIATRGERLVLIRESWSGPDQEAAQGQVLEVFEIAEDQRMTATVTFDPDDIDAAFAELDVRYLAGEAAPYASTWSIITQTYAALNRHELPETPSEFVSVDHHRLALWEGDFAANMRAAWNVAQDWRIRIVAVHRLTDIGAVLTCVVRGTSRQGFDAEIPGIADLTVEGELINRFEYFDDTDLDAALARFDELRRPTPRLQNTACQVSERFLTKFVARDWDAMSELLADDISTQDRRRVVSAEDQHGREAHIADMRVIADLWHTNVTSTAIATRGTRLALMKIGYSSDQGHEPFRADILCLGEINADDQIAAGVMFDLDDVDAAFAELDARYGAGEAADHPLTWSTVASAYEAFNRQTVPPTTPDWVYVDNRRLLTFETGDLNSYARAVWDDTPGIKSRIEVVHRLSDIGAVVTHATYGASREGFDAEWRMVAVMTVDGELFTRYELFDDTDLDAALARFEELSHPMHRLENTATRVYERWRQAFAARDWVAMADMIAESHYSDDRRRVVNGGIHRGRDAMLTDTRAIADVGVTNIELSVTATRGDRLFLGRSRVSGDRRPEAYGIEVLIVVEVDADHRFAAGVVFDLDDADAAFTELDSRYLTGEAAVHAHTWRVITQAYAAVNRQELPPMTPACVDIDHRRGTPFGPGDLTEIIRTSSIITPDLHSHIETVHLLTSYGAVVTQLSVGSAADGFHAEWRMITLVAVEGALMNRIEIFDEADLDAALARFNELDRPRTASENAATRAWDDLATAFNRRDVEAFMNRTSPDGHLDDRRRGLRDSRDAAQRQKVVQTLLDLPLSWRLEIEPVAVRGARLGLVRHLFRDTDETDRPITVEALVLTECRDDLVRDLVLFDPDDIDAAMAELTSRWIASGEVRPS